MSSFSLVQYEMSPK